ncbi:toll/interleukin-1 receptor domain-containing protein [uncultured Acinetobacter sp.]|uniref:toll/interleukin-1 receptor domain-containing protein n=1 Tax=uncultured Acinetobacter sp. TaxID=165433 RepID=UPI002584F4CF|nr:toll/interleukin-1 receptor domain-containing protein [uncultured Acinetobacter sp.]
MNKIPKVFISYAHESEALSDQVLNFSNELRSLGIDAEIDQYEEAPPQGWAKWMLQQIDESDFVLVVASPIYYARSKGSNNDPKGLGAKWETTQIIQNVYQSVNNNTKYIPIFFESDSERYILDPLKPYTFYDISNEKQKDRLIKRLSGKSENLRPKLGKDNLLSFNLEPLEEKSRKTLFVSGLIDIDLWNKAKWKGTAFVYNIIDENDIPILGVGFENPEYGKLIFNAIRNRIGGNDVSEKLRISIVTEVDKENIAHYKVMIGPNESYLDELSNGTDLKNEEKLFMAVSRVNLMTPNNSINLDNFLERYKKVGKFYITNILEMPNGFSFNPNSIDYDNLILKSELVVKTLKEVLKEKNRSQEWAAIVPKKLKPNNDVFKAIKQKHEKEKRRKKNKLKKISKK